MSSSSPISSKFVTSDSKPSGLENVEDKEDDLEDLEPERSGGDPGTLVMIVVMLKRCASEEEANGGRSGCWRDVESRNKSLIVVVWSLGFRPERLLGESAVQSGNAISGRKQVVRC